MKKKGLIIASLLILVLSVFFMGCPPEEKDPAALKDDAIAALKTIGYPKDVPLPAGTTYDTCKGDATKVTITWTSGSQTIFNAYISKFGVTREATLATDDQQILSAENLAEGFWGNILLADDKGGLYNDIDVKPSSIILIINKN
jgi:PBP1b-binding outer membrane lipoprotein LpoB